VPCEPELIYLKNSYNWSYQLIGNNSTGQFRINRLIYKGTRSDMQRIILKFRGAGKKGGLSENQDIGNGYIGNRCISNTSDDVISDMSIPIFPFLAMDISE
jgi:hypothetical protein